MCGRRDRDRAGCDATVGDGGDDDSEATIVWGRRSNGDGRGDGDVDEDRTAKSDATVGWGRRETRSKSTAAGNSYRRLFSRGQGSAGGERDEKGRRWKVERKLDPPGLP